MASYNYNEEKRGLTGSFKSQMGYGTAPATAASRKVTPKTQKFINKKLGKADTLQGIALRYGVTVQDLKRENRLYTNDSLFLRQTLLIPLTPDNQDDLGPDDEVVVVDGPSGKLLAPHGKPDGDGPQDASPLRNGGAGAGSAAVLHVHNEITGATVESGAPGRSSSFTCTTSSSTPPPHSSNHGGVNGKDSGDGIPSLSSDARTAISSSSLPSTVITSATSPPTDFFNKYDQNIAFLKGEIARMENNATDPRVGQINKNLEGLMEPNPLSLPSRKGSQTSASGWASYQVSDDDVDGAPVLLIRSRTNSRQVKTTLERSQQASDDLFEL